MIWKIENLTSQEIGKLVTRSRLRSSLNFNSLLNLLNEWKRLTYILKLKNIIDSIVRGFKRYGDEKVAILDPSRNSFSQFFFPRRRQESKALDANEIPDPFIIVSFECFTAVRLSGGTYGVRDTRRPGSL